MPKAKKGESLCDLSHAKSDPGSNWGSPRRFVVSFWGLVNFRADCVCVLCVLCATPPSPFHHHLPPTTTTSSSSSCSPSTYPPRALRRYLWQHQDGRHHRRRVGHADHHGPRRRGQSSKACVTPYVTPYVTPCVTSSPALHRSAALRPLFFLFPRNHVHNRHDL